MASFWSKMKVGLQAFREAYLSAGTTDRADSKDFSAFGARRLRYALLWSFYEQTAYRDIHLWTAKMRADFGLYKYIRDIHNPAYRLGEFWATHLMGGALDPDAGDGESVPSALPIATDNAALRRAISTLWQASNWQTTKEIWTRTGAVLGDVGLQVVDDTKRSKVYLKIVHPGTIADVDRDPWGNVKRYVIQEQRDDPRWVSSNGSTPRQVTYTETAERLGNDVLYSTYLDETPYAWDGELAEWTEPYGFIPLVLTQHLNVGLDWGWSELHPGLSKIREVDDLASKLSDQIRKTVDSPWLFSGIKRGETATVAGVSSSLARPEPGREEVPALYAADPQAKAQPLVAPLPIGEVSARIKDILAEIERDYPELQMDIWTASGDASGRALRVARQRVTGKAQMRRAGYDDALVRAQQMAIAIGGYRDSDGYKGYEDFAGFNLDSYAQGTLDHHIGQRPVFETDPLDAIEEETAFWTAAKAATDAGLPLELYLARNGWSDQDIAELTRIKAERAVMAQAIAQPQQPTNTPTAGGNPPVGDQ